MLDYKPNVVLSTQEFSAYRTVSRGSRFVAETP